jgi:hypothetical protein
MVGRRSMPRTSWGLGTNQAAIMRRRTINRSIIALIAAYAIAIQAFLSGSVMASHVAAAGDLCATHSEANGSSGHPLGQDNDCSCGPACTMAACDGVVGLVDGAGVAIVWSALSDFKLDLNARSGPALTRAAHGSNSQRGPPIS